MGALPGSVRFTDHQEDPKSRSLKGVPIIKYALKVGGSN